MKELNAAEQAILKKGSDAEALLANPAMTSAINELSEGLVQMIVSTNLEEADKRERYYHLHAALKELVGILSHRVSLKQNLEAEMAETENE